MTRICLIWRRKNFWCMWHTFVSHNDDDENKLIREKRDFWNLQMSILRCKRFIFTYFWAFYFELRGPLRGHFWNVFALKQIWKVFVITRRHMSEARHDSQITLVVAVVAIYTSRTVAMWFNSLSLSINHKSVKKAWNVEQVSLMNISCLASEQTNERGSRHRRRVTAGWHDIYVFLKCFLTECLHFSTISHHRWSRMAVCSTLKLNFLPSQSERWSGNEVDCGYREWKKLFPIFLLFRLTIFNYFQRIWTFFPLSSLEHSQSLIYDG